jgi:hypothetical protein
MALSNLAGKNDWIYSFKKQNFIKVKWLMLLALAFFTFKKVSFLILLINLLKTFKICAIIIEQ